MKGKFKILSLGIFATIGLSIYSCTSDFDEINTSKTKLTALDGPGLSNSYSAAQYYALSSSWQIFQSLFADLQSQYFATCATYFPSDRNVMVGNWLNGAWSGFYGEAMPPLLGVLEATKPGGSYDNPELYALANIWKVYAYLPRTDYWGPIPYSKTGSGTDDIAYDTQEFIYKDFLATLAASTTTLQAFKDKNILSTNDQIYGGDVTKWIKFANSLRLRIAMRMSKVEPALAQKEAEAAVAGGLLETNSDDAFLQVTPNSINPLNQATPWNEFRMSASMESVLKGYSDPRLTKYFAPVPGTTNTYKGLRNGYSQAQLGVTENTPGANSNLAERYMNVSQGSNPIAVLYASESYFLKAEGILKGWNMGGGTAKGNYEKGIQLALNQWGIAPDSITAYINRTSTPIALNDMVKTPALSNIPVKFSSDPTMQLEQIITQKWLANFPNGHEAWAEYRRTGYPKLYARINSDNIDVPANAVLRRTPFVIGEFNTNKTSVTAAIGMLGPGGDKASTRLWWDKP